LFTVTSWIPGGSWAQVQAAAAYGHEIGSHTVTHPTLSGLTAAQQTNELATSQMLINQNITNQSCVTLAYPNCVAALTYITHAYYIAARNCSGQLVPSTPSDFYNISSFVCGPAGSVQTVAQFNNQVNSAAANNSWCVFLIHALDNDNGYSPMASSILQSNVDYVSTNQNKFWVQTFGNVVRYIRERNDSSVSESANTGDSITVQLTGSLDGSIYNFPITVRRPLPAGWPSAAVSQNGIPVGSQIVTVSATPYVMFDAVPNGGDIVLTKSVPPPVLSSPVLNAPNFNFQLTGTPGYNYSISSSTDLISWLPLQTNMLSDTATNLTFTVPDTLQFYRAQWVP
jgi:oligosaccharide reducing-end xylanase